MSGWSAGWIRGRDLAIDLGTANTVVYERGRGVVLDEPSVVAVATGTQPGLVAAGRRAKEMLAHPETVTAVRPLRDGVISDADVTERMIRWFVDRGRPLPAGRPRSSSASPATSPASSVVLSRTPPCAPAPGGSTSSRRRWPRRSAPACPSRGPRPRWSSTSAAARADVGVISLGGIVTSRTVRIGGDEIDEAIVSHVKAEYSLLLGESSAEQLKIGAGSAFPLVEEISERVRGRDLVTGLPKTVTIGSAEVRRAIRRPSRRSSSSSARCWTCARPSSPATSSTTASPSPGGGALLRGLDERLSHELGVPVRAAEDPLRAVARGAGRCVEEFGTLERVLVDTRRRDGRGDPVTMHRLASSARSPSPRWSSCSTSPGAGALQPVRAAAAAALGPAGAPRRTRFGPGGRGSLRGAVDATPGPAARRHSRRSRRHAARRHRDSTTLPPSWPGSSRSDRPVPPDPSASRSSRLTRTASRPTAPSSSADGLVGAGRLRRPWTSDVLLVGGPDSRSGCGSEREGCPRRGVRHSGRRRSRRTGARHPRAVPRRSRRRWRPATRP